MSIVHRLTRDFAKHRLKAGVLGALVVVLVIFVVRAVVELRSSMAATIPPPVGLAKPGSGGGEALVPEHTDADARMKESGMLWEKLRGVTPTAAPAAAAFTFDASFYPPPLVQPQDLHPQAPAVIEDSKPVQATPLKDTAAAKAARVLTQAQGLVVQSTAVGNANTQPVAIVNQQLVTVGQEIMGFEVVAIRSREVEFRKEGITTTRKMPDDFGSH